MRKGNRSGDHSIEDFPQTLENRSEGVVAAHPLGEGRGKAQRNPEGAGRGKGIFFLVGPEGGLSAEEVEGAKKAVSPPSPWVRDMRSETASLYLLSALQYELGGMGIKKGADSTFEPAPFRKEGMKA